MILKCAAAALALIVLGSSPVFADLSDFEKRIEEAEAAAKPDEEEAEPKPDTRTEEQKQAESEFVFAILKIWFYLNFAVDYGDYPYGDRPYIRFRDGDEARWKFYRMSVGADAYLTADSRMGYRAELEGKFLPFIGPRLDVSGLYDGAREQYFVGLGAQASLLQTRWVCADVYGQWVSMKGLVDREGSALGIVLTVYPGAKLSLVAKLGGQSYSSGLELNDWSCSVGRHFGRWELYGGWRSLAAETGTIIGGAFLGCRAHF